MGHNIHVSFFPFAAHNSCNIFFFFCDGTQLVYLCTGNFVWWNDIIVKNRKCDARVHTKTMNYEFLNTWLLYTRIVQLYYRLLPSSPLTRRVFVHCYYCVRFFAVAVQNSFRLKDKCPDTVHTQIGQCLLYCILYTHTHTHVRLCKRHRNRLSGLSDRPALYE